MKAVVAATRCFPDLDALARQAGAWLDTLRSGALLLWSPRRRGLVVILDMAGSWLRLDGGGPYEGLWSAPRRLSDDLPADWTSTAESILRSQSARQIIGRGA